MISLSAFAAGKAKPLATISLATHPGGTHMMTMAGSVNGKDGLFLFDTGGGVS